MAIQIITGNYFELPYSVLKFETRPVESLDFITSYHPLGKFKFSVSKLHLFSHRASKLVAVMDPEGTINDPTVVILGEQLQSK